MGMRLVKGLGEEDAERIGGAVRARGPFRTVESLRRVAGVRVGVLRALASADAFRSMGLDRQHALWELRSLRDERLPLFEDGADESPSLAGLCLPPVEPARQVVHDYNATSLSLKAHPVSFVRGELDARGVTPNAVLADPEACPHGRPIRVAGVVLIRQRPSTASGIVFVTIEDETGIANLIVFPSVYERYRRAARHAVSIVAEGNVERQGVVVHVRVRTLSEFALHRSPVTVRSRDFH